MIMKTSALLFLLLTGGTLSVSAQTYASAAVRPTTDGMEVRDIALAPVVTVEENAQAAFPGGTKALAQYLKQEFTMNDFARENGLEGTILVRCTIDTDGKVTDATVIESVHPVIDAEALHAVKNMPAWSPSTKNGQVTQTRIEIPFQLRLR